MSGSDPNDTRQECAPLAAAPPSMMKGAGERVDGALQSEREPCDAAVVVLWLTFWVLS